jgi:hypothetical protein
MIVFIFLFYYFYFLFYFNLLGCIYIGELCVGIETSCSGHNGKGETICEAIGSSQETNGYFIFHFYFYFN